MTRSKLAIFVSLIAASAVLTGCRSNDPYCQTAIANLRAEKIQLENEYYALKSKYELETGQVSGIDSGFNTPTMPTISDGEIIYDSGYSDAGISTGNSGLVNSGVPTMAAEVSNSPASWIRSIDVNQLAAGKDEMTRLLVRPLDIQGAIMPVAGAIKLRLYNPDSGQQVYENEYSVGQVSAWVYDQPGQGPQPGIHLSIPGQGITQINNRLICELQYRTADNRILKQRLNLEFNTGSMSVTGFRSQPAGQARPLNRGRGTTRNAVSTGIPEQPLEGLDIEIGSELDFDSLGEEESGSRPAWSPDR